MNYAGAMIDGDLCDYQKKILLKEKKKAVSIQILVAIQCEGGDGGEGVGEHIDCEKISCVLEVAECFVGKMLLNFGRRDKQQQAVRGHTAKEGLQIWHCTASGSSPEHWVMPSPQSGG